MPESLLSSPNIDYVIRGEGEKPFVEFLKYLKGNQGIERVPNLAYKSRGEIILNPISDNFPIEELSIPDFSDLLPTSYALAGKPMTFMITSRSCPHKCSFCSVHTTFGTDYRRRSLENVLEEIELRYQSRLSRHRFRRRQSHLLQEHFQRTLPPAHLTLPQS